MRLILERLKCWEIWLSNKDFYSNKFKKLYYFKNEYFGDKNINNTIGYYSNMLLDLLNNNSKEFL